VVIHEQYGSSFRSIHRGPSASSSAPSSSRAPTRYTSRTAAASPLQCAVLLRRALLLSIQCVMQCRVRRTFLRWLDRTADSRYRGGSPSCNCGRRECPMEDALKAVVPVFIASLPGVIVAIFTYYLAILRDAGQARRLVANARILLGMEIEHNRQ